MKVVLISPIRNVTAANFRGLGAALVRAGHDVVQIFLPDMAADANGKAVGGEFPYETPYPDSLAADVAAACEDAGFVGVSLMTNHFERVADLTRRLRPRVAAPIVWGGIHPTVRPQECLEFADAVALGEADETIVDFADRLHRDADWHQTPGFWVRRNGRMVMNPTPPPPADLGVLPPPLYQPDRDLVQVRETGRLEALTDERLATYTELIHARANAGIGGSLYMANASRGCLHACSFCSNAFLKKINQGYKGTRWRPAGHLIAELAAVRQRFPFVKYVFFSDDEFLAQPPAFFEEFARRWPAEVGLPFRCFTSADTITRENLEAFVPLGFFLVEVGIQSAAAKTNTSYRRRWLAQDKIVATAELLNEYAPKIIPTYDLLTDNPYEGARERLDTARFINRLPRPYFLQIFSLTFYPGTDLYEQARGDGRITDDFADVYRKNSLLVENRDYLYYLTALHNVPFVPRWFLKIAAWTPFVWFYQYPPGGWLFKLVTGMARVIFRPFKRRGP